MDRAVRNCPFVLGWGGRGPFGTAEESRGIPGFRVFLGGNTRVAASKKGPSLALCLRLSLTVYVE